MSHFHKTLFSFPCCVHILALFAFMWYPVIQMFRFFLSSEGMTYTGVEGTDLALFIWTMNSPYVDFLALRDLEADINIFFRADYMSILLLPFALIFSAFDLSGHVGYTFVLCLWNAINVYAVYYFYFAFFQSEQISSLASYFSYSLSGVSGLLIFLNWIFNLASSNNFSFHIDIVDWVGENHKISNEFADGNAITNLTNMSRAHYLAPRAFGLFSVALFHKVVSNPSSERKTLTTICLVATLLFLCAVIHPASGLVYLSMFAILIGFYFIQKDRNLPHRASRLFLFPFSGFLGAIIYWQVYRSIPESRNSVESYLLILHNTDSLPLLLATIPTLGFVLFFIFRKLNNFFATFLCIIAIVSWLLGLSEFFIRTYSVGIRAILLALSLTSVGLLFFIFRFAFVKSLQDSRLQCGILMTIWAILAIVISSSPHHDIRTVLYATKSDSKVIEVLRHLSDFGKMVFAARFKLGIWIPLIGAFVFFAYQTPSKLRRIVFVVVFLTTLPSTIIYLYLTCNQGQILEEEREAYLFLRSQSGRNVMCAPETGVFLPNLSLKRCFGPSAGDPNWRTHLQDVEEFYKTFSDSLRRSLIEKYRIDFIVVGRNERAIGANPDAFNLYPKIFERGGTAVYKVN